MSEETAQTINELDSGKSSENVPPRTLEGEILKRRRRRRLDLVSLPGALRESGRIYRDLVEGRISMAQAEVRSRVLRRHTEALGAYQQQQVLESLNEKIAGLEALQRGSPLTQLPSFDDPKVSE